MPGLRKYPRTEHIEGSRQQPGDEDLQVVPFRQIAGRHLVVEEKIDGANTAISFDEQGALLLQSRGHYLTGGPRERHFNLFKSWANMLAGALRPILGSRYVLYGEWLYAKHTVFYDQLPHYFFEFDVLDQTSGDFLSTERRRALLQGAGLISVPVLKMGAFKRLQDVTALLQHSLYKGEDWRAHLRAGAAAAGIDPEMAARQSDTSDLMEGLYLKVEEDGKVVERYKFVRPDFLTAIADSGTHWLDRPILPNRLAPGVDIFEPVAP